MSRSSQYTIDVLDVAFDVIECLSAHNEQTLTASQIARELGIQRTRAYRILKTLEARGYVEDHQPSGGFRLGMRFVPLAAQVRNRIDLLRTAEPILIELAKTTGDISYLLVRIGMHALIIDRYIGHHRLQAMGAIGELLPLHVGAGPKALLAFAPETERMQILHEMALPRWTKKTITDREELRRHLEVVRARGYALDEEESEIGNFAVTAPVFDHTGSAVAAVSITTPGVRFNSDRRDKLIRVVIQAAQTISAKLGYAPP
jgi:DNA-binding IclR family transcriptional regulator